MDGVERTNAEPVGVAGADDLVTCHRFRDALLSLQPGLVARPEDLFVTNDCDLLAAAIGAPLNIS